MRLVASEPDQSQPHRMSRGHQHGAEQNRHVVAIARLQFEHPSGRVQQLDLENVARVADVAPHPIEEGADLAEAILGARAVSAEDLYGLLPHVKIFRALADQLRDQTRSHQRPARPSRHAADDDARLDVSRTKLDHSSLTLIIGRVAARNALSNRRAGKVATGDSRRIRVVNKELTISASEMGKANRRREVINFMTVRRGARESSINLPVVSDEV